MLAEEKKGEAKAEAGPGPKGSVAALFERKAAEPRVVKEQSKSPERMRQVQFDECPKELGRQREAEVDKGEWS